MMGGAEIAPSNFSMKRLSSALKKVERSENFYLSPLSAALNEKPFLFHYSRKKSALFLSCCRWSGNNINSVIFYPFINLIYLPLTSQKKQESLINQLLT